MENIIEFSFRFIAYVVLGFSLEVIFSVVGIEFALGTKLKRRVPKKYLEGHVSLYMIPIHGLGMLFGFELLRSSVIELNIFLKYLIYAVGITATEAITGFLYDKSLGHYCWDYYETSPYKVFKRGYTLWTLLPLWGIAGLIMEIYVGLLIYLSPSVVKYFTEILGR